MSARISTLRRQWIPVSGGSCDVRMGYDALEQAAPLFGDSVGRPCKCVVVHDAHLSEEIRERLSRQLSDAGFTVGWHVADADAPRSVDEVCRLYHCLMEAHITGEDLCCAIGGTDVIALASHACAGWCGGMSLVAIPLDEVAFLEGSLIPRALDVGDAPAMVGALASARHVLLDYDLALSDWDSEASRYARVLMVSAAMSGSERSFSDLWDSAASLAQKDEEEYVEQIVQTAKRRGQTISSASVAVRQSLDYGLSFAHALGSIAGNRMARSLLLAEGMRFSARVSVSQNRLSMDDMLAQDELLATLGLGEAVCQVRPHDLAQAIRDELLLRGNRTMLLVPFGIGQVRYMSVSDDLLLEHAKAWCGAHSA